MMSEMKKRPRPDQFAESHPDLVLLDVMMPHFNGFDDCG
jgi:DNA-binding response OmpR family regulator